MSEHAPCAHRSTSLGQVYEYCEGCGAVRVRPELRPDDGRWHSCAECSTKAKHAALAAAREAP